MSSEIAIRARDISKHYVMFARPEDRLKQMIVPRLQRALGRPPTRYFRDFAALNNVSFDIRRGETVGIIGRNGSGKSTLLQIICGTLRPTSGSIEVNGRIAALLELGAGFNPEFTGRENVYLNAAILGLSRAEIDARFESIARFADIGDFIEQPVKTYSSGMYVRLAFATAINVDPDILVVDEALAVGDEAFQRKCYARIEQIKERGSTILFVSHAAQTIVQLCDRAMLMDTGDLLLIGEPKHVTNQYQRLIYADIGDAERIRSNIRNCSETGKSSQNEIVSSPLTLANTEFFDPSFQSASITEIGSNKAKITALTLKSEDGASVNQLVLGRRYTLAISVDFLTNCGKAAYGMAVRNMEGTSLAGAMTGYNFSAKGGDQQTVEISFICRMLPGSYFIGSTVYGGNGEVLHRIVDALAIRVLPESGLIAAGYFDLSPKVAEIAKPDRPAIRARPPLLSPSQVANAISDAVKEKRPFSFIRLGDSEGMMLLTRKYSQTEEDRQYLSTHFDPLCVTEAVSVLTRELNAALNSADLIGNRDDVWYANSSAVEINVDDADFVERFRTALKLRDAERDIDAHALRRLFGLHEWTQAQRSFPIPICSSWIPYDLALMGFWDELLGSVREVTLINCSPTLPSVFSRIFSIDVQHIIIPDLEIHRDRWKFDSRRESIYPDSFRRVHAEIEEMEPGRLCLIGAGVPGKSYAAAIKRRGGIALDLGGLLDAWDDRLTRPLVFSTKSPSSEPETAHRPFMLGASR